MDAALLTSMRGELDNFMPLPYITMKYDLAANRRKLKCRICWETGLRLRSGDQKHDDCTPGMFPCGHFAGYKCLRKWEKEHPGECPFCKVVFTYSACKHTVAAKPIDETTLELMPRTLPDGGSIPEKCACCRSNTGDLDDEELHQHTLSFLQARAEYAEAQTRANSKEEKSSAQYRLWRMKETKKVMMFLKALLDAHRELRKQPINEAVVNSLQSW